MTNAGPEKRTILTDAQERSLAVGLSHIETELAWAEALLGWTYSGTLKRFDDDLGDSAHRQLRAGIDEAREMIRGLASTLGLEAEVTRKSRSMVGRMAHLWVVAQECQSRYLRGYGDVAPELPAVVDPVARRLAELFLSMERIASEAGGEGSVSGPDVQPGTRAP